MILTARNQLHLPSSRSTHQTNHVRWTLYQGPTLGYSLHPLDDSNDQGTTLTGTTSEETQTPAETDYDNAAVKNQSEQNQFPTTPAIASQVNATNAPKSPTETLIPLEKPSDATTREERERREDEQGIADVNAGNGALSGVPHNSNISPEDDSDSTLTTANSHSKQKKRKNPPGDAGYISDDEDDTFSSDEEEFEEPVVEQLVEEEVEEM